MEELNLLHEEENKRKGTVLSVVLHLLLLLLCLLPAMSYQDPPPDQLSVLVAFGAPEENPQNKEVSRAPEEIKETTKPKAQPKKASTKPTKSSKKSKPASKTTTLDDPEVKIIAKGEIVQDEKILEAKKAADAKKKEAEIEATKIADAEAEVKRKADAEAEAKKKAEEEAKAAAEAKKQALEAKKSEFGDLLKKGTGDSSKPTGSEKGDPNSSALDGMITGDGKIGGGLRGRSMLYEPVLTDNSQKTGVVVVRVCVNLSGKVIEAKFTQKGSSTTDSYLVNLAESHARKYKFSPGELDKQCGTLTLEFKLK